MSSLRRSSAEIFFQVCGEKGSWVTLINGYTRDSSDFRTMSRYLERHGFRVLTFDNRGAGQTKTASAFSLEDICHDINALWKHLGVKKSFVLGISMGGMIAQILASLYQEEVQRVVLVSTTSSPQEVIRPSSEVLLDEESALKWIHRYVSQEFIAKNSGLISIMARTILARHQDVEAKKGFAFQKDAMVKSQKTLLACNISQPVAVIHGSDDKIVHSDQAKQLAKKYSAKKVVIIPDCGHLVLAEKPKKLFEEAVSFLT